MSGVGLGYRQAQLFSNLLVDLAAVTDGNTGAPTVTIKLAAHQQSWVAFHVSTVPTLPTCLP
jgi:hypothetical protein